MARINNNDIAWSLTLRTGEAKLVGIYHLDDCAIHETVIESLPGHAFDDPGFRMTHIYKKMQEGIRQKFTRILSERLSNRRS